MRSCTLFLALAVAALASRARADDPDYVRQCRGRCNALRSTHTYREHYKDGCASFLTQLPKPSVFDTCRFGYGQSKGAVCDLVCEYPEIRCDGSLLSEPAISSRVREACSPLRKRRPAPLMFQACETGFRTATLRLCEDLKEAEKPHLEARREAQDQEREAESAATQQAEATRLQEQEGKREEERSIKQAEAVRRAKQQQQQQQQQQQATSEGVAEEGPEAAAAAA